jgi:hypothetical protein
VTPREVETIVARELVNAPDASDVRSACIAPFPQQFVLNDTYEQMSVPVKGVVTYWVVALGQFYSVFYDPAAREFGLADLPREGVVPHTSGVRGDLVSTFRAM